MGLFDNFPYTNFHELNLDWVIRILKALDKSVDVLTTDVATLTDEVENFIENADIPGVVRDELLAMYADGRLAELVTEAVVAISDKITYHFVGGGTEGDGNSYGSPVILECSDGLILFDFGYDEWAMLNAIMATGKTKIKAIVISHYHDDHIGGFNRVITSGNLDFTGCVAFLPHANIQWERMLGADWTSIQNDESRITNVLTGLLGETNVIHPAEGDKYEGFDNLSLEFFNLSANYFNAYYDYMLNANGSSLGYTQYNNFSMVCVIDHYSGGRCVIPGDIHDIAEANCFRAFIGANIVMAPHHGLNRLVAPEYVNALTPDVFIMGTGATAYPIETYYHADYAQANAAGAECYYTFTNNGVRVDDSARGIKAQPVGGIKSTCNGPASPYFNMGMAWTEAQLTADQAPVSDLNAITYPSVYSVQNATGAALITNAPWTNTGFWLITREITASHTILQEAIAVGSDTYRRAYRRASYSGGAFTWDPDGWFYDSAADQVRHALVAADFTAGGTVTIHTGINQNVATENANVLCIGLDITPSAAISAGTAFLLLDEFKTGQGCYGALFTAAGDVYPVSMRYVAGSGVTVRAERAIPAGTHVYGTLVCMRNPL